MNIPVAFMISAPDSSVLGCSMKHLSTFIVVWVIFTSLLSYLFVAGGLVSLTFAPNISPTAISIFLARS